MSEVFIMLVDEAAKHTRAARLLLEQAKLDASYIEPAKRAATAAENVQAVALVVKDFGLDAGLEFMLTLGAIDPRKSQ